MGKFGTWLTPEPDLKHYKGELFITRDPIEFIDTDNSSHRVEVDFITDIYSKPWITQILVGDKEYDDHRPAILHDYDCKTAIANKKAGLPYEPFNVVNDRFYRSMRATNSIPTWKCLLMRWSVNLNPDRW